MTPPAGIPADLAADLTAVLRSRWPTALVQPNCEWIGDVLMPLIGAALTAAQARAAELEGAATRTLTYELSLADIDWAEKAATAVALAADWERAERETKAAWDEDVAAWQVRAEKAEAKLAAAQAALDNRKVTAVVAPTAIRSLPWFKYELDETYKNMLRAALTQIEEQCALVADVTAALQGPPTEPASGQEATDAR